MIEHLRCDIYALFQAFVALDLEQYRSLAQKATENCESSTRGAYANPNGDIIPLHDPNTAAEQSSITYDRTHTLLTPGPGSLPVVIEVTGEMRVGALHRLVELERELNSVALNFANPVEAGGGFAGGAQP
jgi:hypothetical protein